MHTLLYKQRGKGIDIRVWRNLLVQWASYSLHHYPCSRREGWFTWWRRMVPIQTIVSAPSTSIGPYYRTWLQNKWPKLSLSSEVKWYIDRQWWRNSPWRCFPSHKSYRQQSQWWVVSCHHQTNESSRLVHLFSSKGGNPQVLLLPKQKSL